MEEKGHRSEDDLERRCEAVSPAVEPCDYPATVHCAKCGRWFYDAHAEDEEWHPCMLPCRKVSATVLHHPRSFR
jgi:hypothetical protein